MPEVAIALPFDADEVKTIICQELRKRLDQLSPLYGLAQYRSFDAQFQVKITLRAPAEVDTSKQTLAWGELTHGQAETSDQSISANVEDSFTPGDPNEERMARDMLLTVEADDGRGGKASKKVRVKAA